FSAGRRSSRDYTLSLHDALPIFVEVWGRGPHPAQRGRVQAVQRLAAPLSAIRRERAHVVAHTVRAVRQRLTAVTVEAVERQEALDRKSTRLNSSHVKISYAVFCL